MLSRSSIICCWCSAAQVVLLAQGEARYGDPSFQLRGTRGTDAATSHSRFFLWLSDVHLDPYYGTTNQQCNKDTAHTAQNEFGTFGCDAPYSLVKSALVAAADLNVEFVLFTGDFTRHDQNLLMNPSSNVSDIIRNVSQLISSAFPAMVSSDGFAIGALGNDDSPKDYELSITTCNSTNGWLDRVGDVLGEEGVMPHKVFDQYDYGGFFNVSIGGIEILSLDTVIYSVFHTPTPSQLPEDPFNQLAWLRQQLEAATAQGKLVWIIGHIPPGMETYGYTELWHKQYLDAYLNLVEDPKLGGCIAAQLFGHVHTEEIRVLPNAPEGAGPVFTMGSISPIFHNNPSFRVVEYDAFTGRMLDYSDYYAKLPNGKTEPEWRLGYRASEAYKPLKAAKESGGITSHSVKELAAELVLGGEEFTTYARWYKTNHSSDLEACAAKHSSWEPHLSKEAKTRCIMMYLCAVSITREDIYQHCTERFVMQNISKSRLADLAGDVPAFYEAARHAHWLEVGLNASWVGGGFA